MLITMMIPVQATVIPRFILFKTIGIYNTLWALILPAFFNVTSIFLLRQFYLSLPDSFVEAAKIDGANTFQIFKNVTIPVLSPSIFFVVIITAIYSFQVFDLIYLMTQGGPLDSTNVLVYAIYKNAFEYFNVGKASAIAYVLFVIILVLTLAQWNLRKKIVYIED